MAIIFSNTSITFGNYTLTEKADGFEFDGVIKAAAGLCDTRVFQGEISGYLTAGRAPPTFPLGVDTIEKFSFVADGNSSDVGELTQARWGVAGHSSDESGYSSGGHPPPAGVNIIDKFPFATDSSATAVASLFEQRYLATGQSSKAQGFGYASGGVSPPPGRIDTIEKFSFAVDSNGSDVGELTCNRCGGGGHSSPTFGYTSGGFVPGCVNIIDKFPFATDASATDVGDMTTPIRDVAGHSSLECGYASGGTVYLDTIQKFSFVTDGNASDVAEITQARQTASGTSSSTHGYTTAGLFNPPVPGTSVSNVIDKFPFASDTNSTDVGDITLGRYNVGSVGQQV